MTVRKLVSDPRGLVKEAPRISKGQRKESKNKTGSIRDWLLSLEIPISLVFNMQSDVF